MKPAGRPTLDLAALFDEHQKSLLALALRITGDFALAEDALQQTFLHAHKGASTFRGDSSAGTWLYRITAREALRLRGRRTRRREEPIDAAALSPSPPDTRHSLAWREQTEELLRALDRLPEEQRLALVLLSARELSAEEIGAMLDVPPATVYTRAFRARMALRERLQSLHSAAGEERLAR